MFLIDEKEEIARNRLIKAFDGSDIQVLNGRYGPYISDGKLNGRIPKDREPASLTLEEVTQLLAETGKPMRGRFGKKAAAKKAPAKKAAARRPRRRPAKKAAKKTAKKAGEEDREEDRVEESRGEEDAPAQGGRAARRAAAQAGRNVCRSDRRRYAPPLASLDARVPARRSGAVAEPRARAA